MSKCAAANCEKEGTLKCSKCGDTSYCSSDCQLSDWKLHRNSCGKSSPVPKSPTPTAAAPAEEALPSSPASAEVRSALFTKSEPDANGQVKITLAPEAMKRMQELKEGSQKAFASGNLPAVIKLGEEGLAFVKELPGPIAVSESCMIHLNMTSAFLQMKNLDKADQHSQTCLKLAELVGKAQPGNPHGAELALMASGSRSFVLMARGDLGEASTLSSSALAIAEKLYPKNDPRLFKPLRGLAIIRDKEGNSAEAEKLFFRAYSMLSLAGKASSRDAQMTLDELINMLMRKGTKEDAEKAERYAASSFKTIGDKKDPNDEMVFGDAAARLAAIGVKLGKFASSEELMQLCLKVRTKYLKPNDLGLAFTLIQLVGTQEPQGKIGMDVEANLLRALEIFNAGQGPNSPEATKTMNSLRMLRAKRQSSNGGGNEEEEDDGTFVTSESTTRKSGSASPTSPAGGAPPSSSSATKDGKIMAKDAGPYDGQAELNKIEGLRPDDADTRMAFAHKFFEMARYNCAEVMIDQAVKIYLTQKGPEHPQTKQALSNLHVVRNNHLNKLWMEVLAEEEAKSSGKGTVNTSGSAEEKFESAASISDSDGDNEYAKLVAKSSSAQLPFAAAPVEQAGGCVIC